MNKHSIVVEELTDNIEALGLTRGDYIVTFPADFYNGAGIYIMEFSGLRYFAKCIEMLDGRIKICDDVNGRMISATDFKKAVRQKIFAKVTIDSNIPSIASSELRELLIKE